ncbi:MAG: hypothetical protein WCY46_08260 [Tissierellaceae bacterium]
MGIGIIKESNINSHTEDLFVPARTVPDGTQVWNKISFKSTNIEDIFLPQGNVS